MVSLLGGLAACSSQESNTKIVVAVWSDLTVPTEIDSIHIDVTGPTSSRTGSFPLATGNQTGNSKPLVVLALAPPDNQDLSFAVTASGFLGNNPNPVVSQKAIVSFLHGQSRVLTLFLGRACPRGLCNQLDVDPRTLPVYDPKALPSPPDAGAGPRLDSGVDGVAADRGGAETSTVDATAEGGQTGDSAADKPADLPVSTPDSGAGDGGGDTGTGGTGGSGGTGGTTGSTGGTGGSGVGGSGDAGLPETRDAQPDLPVADVGLPDAPGAQPDLPVADAGLPDAPGAQPDLPVADVGLPDAPDAQPDLLVADAGLPDAPDARPDLPVGGDGGTVPYVLPTATTDVYLGARSLVLDGTKAYITVAADTSLKVLDVSNPLSPAVLGSVNHGYGDSQLAAHAVHNNIVWVVRSSCCGYGYATSMFGVDVSNPASPYVRGFLQLQTASSLVSWWSNLLVYSGYLLVQDYAQNKVYVIDISNPDAPKKFSEWSTPWMVDGGDAGMTIDGHYLYMPCRQAMVLNIYDLTNLAAVTLAGSVSTGSEEALEWPVKIGSYLYMNVSTYGSGVVHMKVIDVSNPAAPTIVGTVASTGETITKNGRLFSLGTSGSNAITAAYSLANPIVPVVQAASTVPPPSPSTTLNLWQMASPQAGWVGNYLIGVTDGSANYSGLRAVYFPVN
jgi:hypothetical protein